MRKALSSWLVPAALAGSTLLFISAFPASATANTTAPSPVAAGSFSCDTSSKTYTVSVEKAAAHSTPSPNSSVVEYKYKGNSIASKYHCSNSSGEWVCYASCVVEEDQITGRWINENDLA
ncbi:hypothetical protein [Streptomyces odontomachi]|uniref:hypothetical protein n=1 Tax=Streptomyces odontomachi TaxID=2944940 RepID=UPI0021090DBC|nr:hypothetical protein [Streptomyces sp. ODS25]